MRIILKHGYNPFSCSLRAMIIGLMLIGAFYVLFAQVEKVSQIEKEITPQVIAGDLCSKIIVKDIIVDSEGVQIFVTDALRWNEETESYEVYYTDIAFAYWDIPVQLTDEEIESLE